ncbi:MAG: DUF6273 domain-containing protein [Spirochaetaceae bacterium]|nr:DUF6273 domain-containing protein [Spirochaetaceae bacterium]
MNKVEIGGVEIGGRVQFGNINGEPLIWRVAAKDHKGFPEDTVTIVTEGTIGNITFAPADPLDKIRERRFYGSNRYKDSYARRYINSDEFIQAVFSTGEIAAIARTEVKTKQPDIDGGGIDTVSDLLFLLSASEAGHEDEDGEGSLLELFKDAESLRARDIDGDYDWWWLRSAVVSDSCSVRYVYSDGSANYNVAYGGYWGVRPACNLLSGTPVCRV